MNVICQRCKELNQNDKFCFSLFDSKKICISCRDKEKEHPLYNQAKVKELEAAFAKNLSFKGIGLPEELVAK